MDLTYLAIQIAIVIGINEAIKQAFLEDEHYKLIPIMALVIGLLTSIFLYPADTIQQSMVNGLIVGLSSVGLFSTVKNTKQAI